MNVDAVSDEEKEIEEQSKWIESDESIKVKVQKDVKEPTQAESDEHNVAHVPFRSWCPHCVKGKAKGAQHRKQDNVKHELPTVSFDYFYLVKKAEGEERGQPLVAIQDDESGMLRSAVLKQKGVEEYSIAVLQKFIEMLGYKKIIVKTDDEPAIVALKREVKSLTQVEMILEESPAYESKSEGKGENAVQRVQGQFRT